jgi:putative ABC transport system permease protein
MIIPLKYNYRSMLVRRVGTLMTIISIALVVAIFIGVMALANGIQAALVTSGDPLNILVRRRGSGSEMSSSVSPEAMQIMKYLSGIKNDPGGAPLVSPEIVVVINLPKRGKEQGSNITIRGISPHGLTLRPQVHLVEGRMYEPGLKEAVVSRAILHRFEKTKIGDQLRLGKADWKIVGVFDAGNTAFDSEIWVDVNQLADDYNRQSYSSALLRASDEAAVSSISQIIENDQRYNLTAERETEYYLEQTQAADPIKVLGMFIAVVMGIGGCFAAMNTMYSAVAYRGQEIATLRVLGFKRRSILYSFMIESLILALAGGLLGCLLVWPIDGFMTGTTNWRTFSEMAFAFHISPRLLLEGMMLAGLIGLFGGLMPARQAMRQMT